MYPPQYKEERFFTAYLMEKYNDTLDVYYRTWETITCPNTGEVLCIAPTASFIFK